MIFKVKKHFGQHFLKDPLVLQEIIQSIANDSLQIVEIGSGLGDLTKELLKKASVLAYEIDKDAISLLKTVFVQEIKEQKLQLINADILQMFHGELLQDPYKIIANLPYNIGTEIILRGLADKNCYKLLVLVQKEVGEKFCAKVGESNFSSLAVIAQSIGTCKIITRVSPRSFVPPPKVDSVVIEIVKEKQSLDKDFAKFLRLCFCAPRKKLIKNLANFYDKTLLEPIFTDLGLRDKRPHQTSTELFLSLFHTLNLKDKKWHKSQTQ